jgi:hypothetical protein
MSSVRHIDAAERIIASTAQPLFCHDGKALAESHAPGVDSARLPEAESDHDLSPCRRDGGAVNHV